MPQSGIVLGNEEKNRNPDIYCIPQCETAFRWRTYAGHDYRRLDRGCPRGGHECERASPGKTHHGDPVAVDIVDPQQVVKPGLYIVGMTAHRARLAANWGEPNEARLC